MEKTHKTLVLEVLANGHATMEELESLTGLARKQIQAVMRKAPQEFSRQEDGSFAIPAAGFAAAFAAAGGDQPRQLCRALRVVASAYRACGKARKDFLADAAAFGLKPGNAAAEWQASRNV